MYVGHVGDERMGIGQPSGVLDAFIADIVAETVGDVIPDRIVEQDRLLADDGDLRSEMPELEMTGIAVVEQLRKWIATVDRPPTIVTQLLPLCSLSLINVNIIKTAYCITWPFFFFMNATCGVDSKLFL